MVVVGNEKGGAGKSTVAALIATAMLYQGKRVSVIDLDLRQQSLSRLLANRRRWLPAAGVSLVSGAASPAKVIELRGVTAEQAWARLLA